MRPFANEITAGDFALTEGHRRIAISVLVSRHLEFRRAPLDRCGLIWRLYGAKPFGFGGDFVDGPDGGLRLFRLLCHAHSIGRELWPTEPRPSPKLLGVKSRDRMEQDHSSTPA
jgi:hypothetical protein